MFQDFNLIFSWWLLLFFLGIISLPLTWFLFKEFWDNGYAFAKVLGILCLSYFVWLAASLKILPFNLWTILFFVVLLTLANFLLLRKFKDEFLEKIKSCRKIIVLEEIIFLLALTSWTFIRGFQPNIEGLEKFMDFGFVNTITRAKFFPPADMWMAGETINYYYFGHFITALLTKISSLPSFLTYNLMMATLFAFTFILTFSFILNLSFFSFDWSKKKFNGLIFIGSFLGASLASLGANLHTLWWFFKNGNFNAYWYPDATRFIVEKFGAGDNTIHEFPIYSFVVSDLHGHVLNIPFVLLFLALTLSFLKNIKKNGKEINFIYVLPFSLTLAVMFMTNSWDFPIYLGLLGLILFSFLTSERQKLKRALGKTLGFISACFLFSLFFSLPFNLHFSPMAGGVDFVNARSPFWQLLVLWGYQWFTGSIFLFFLWRRKNRQSVDTVVLVLLVWATLLIITPEIIYLKDIYIASYHRANTMFKLTYQSFVLFSLASGYIFTRIIFLARKKIFLSLLFLILFTPALIYPYFAIPSYYGKLKNYQGLNASLNFLKTASPDDFKAISWLNQNVVGQPVVLEAAGDSYTQFNRVSAITGLPTVEGWLVHEWLWRGSFDEPGKRASEVQTIYETSDLNLTKSLLEKYKVEYVFVGEKEREKYKLLEKKFAELGRVAFSSGNTTVYSLP